MGTNSKKIFSFILALTILFDVVVFAKKTFFKNDLINIDKLSQKFMDNYFEEVSKTTEEEKRNMLIVTSMKKLEDTYGASRVIEAPNHQYFLQYDSEEEKEEALNKFNSGSSDIEVSENHVYELYEDTVLVSSYNSWGVEAMGIDTLLQKLENKELNDVVVAIIDSGLDVELFNKYYPGRLAGVHNILDNNDSMYDNHGHGTHIAGTIAESTPSNVKILPIKASDEYDMTETDYITALNYIAYNQNADVINMSFGCKSYSKVEYDLIESIKEKNIISVAAAGNDNTSNPSYPAAYGNTLSVSAVDSNKEKADFSNYGDGIMFAAPGDYINSILGENANIVKWHEEDGFDDGDADHEVMSGTSMAAPHVVAAVANIKSLNKKLSFGETITILRRYSDDLGDTGWDEFYGFGFINFEYAQPCDGHDCDEFNVFKSSPRDSLEGFFEDYEIEPILSEYDYGTVTNVLGTIVKVNYTDGNVFEYRLGDIADLKMGDYDPVSKETQTISISFETPHGIKINDTFEVTNPQDYESIWEYELVGDNEIEITDFKGDSIVGSKLYFPSSIDGYTVTGIADRDNTMFGQSVWNSFKKVKYLYLPSSITKIGNHAFSYQDDMDSFLTTSLAVVESDADSIYVGDDAFNQSHYLEIFDAPVSYVGDRAFYGTYLPDIKFTDDITHIGSDAFGWALPHQTIVIPSTVTEIGRRAFSGESVKEITFENSMKKITDEMFWNDWNLQKVTLPDDVEQIGEKAFYHCMGLEIINLPEGLTTIGDNAFEGSFGYEGGVVITIPSSVISIGTDAFKDIDSTAKLQVYSSAYAKYYAHDNNINYVQIDPDVVSVQGVNSQYNAFDTVDMSNVSLELTYNEETTRIETITENIEIEYPNSRENLRYGDTSVKLVAYNEAGYKIEENVTIEVLKLQPEYNVPTGLSASDGQKLSQIYLPSGFEWIDVNQIVSKTGVYKARFVPTDSINYETVENIDITITVRPYVVNNYTVDENNDIISNITPNTELNSFTSNIILGYGYGIDADSKEVNGKQVLYTGAKVRITHGLDLYKEYTVSVIGDINGDGDISVSDVSMIYKNLKRKNEFNGAQSIASNVNGDDGVSVSDISMIYKHIKRKINLGVSN